MDVNIWCTCCLSLYKILCYASYKKNVSIRFIYCTVIDRGIYHDATFWYVARHCFSL